MDEENACHLQQHGDQQYFEEHLLAFVPLVRQNSVSQHGIIANINT